MILTQYQKMQNSLITLIQSKDKNAPRIADIQKMIYILAREHHLDILQCTQELEKCVSINNSFTESRVLLQRELDSGLSLRDAGIRVREQLA